MSAKNLMRTKITGIVEIANKDDGPIKRSSVREMHHPWRVNGLNPNYKYADGRTCAVATAYNYGMGWLKDCDNKIYTGILAGFPVLAASGASCQIMELV